MDWDLNHNMKSKYFLFFNVFMEGMNIQVRVLAWPFAKKLWKTIMGLSGLPANQVRALIFMFIFLYHNAALLVFPYLLSKRFLAVFKSNRLK